MGTETERLNGLETQKYSVAETQRPRRTPAKRGLLARPQENLCTAEVIGGASSQRLWYWDRRALRRRKLIGTLAGKRSTLTLITRIREIYASGT
jgi:hypothetical protein